MQTQLGVFFFFVNLWKEMLKSSIVFWFIGELFDLVMGKPENIGFHDFWMFGTLGTVIRGFWYTELLRKIAKKSFIFWKHLIFEQMTFGNLKMLKLVNLGTSSLSCLKIWTFDILKFRNFEIFTILHFAFLRFWNFGTLEFWNFEKWNSWNT